MFFAFGMGLVAVAIFSHGLRQKQKWGVGYVGDFVAAGIAAVLAVVFACVAVWLR